VEGLLGGSFGGIWDDYLFLTFRASTLGDYGNI
jgi:hypothetical protein